MDLHLINEGRHEQLWDVLGAHVRRYESPTGDVTGTSFAVWAPHARGVRVKGDFNSWDGREHPMRQMGVSGVWELFVPDVGAGTHYKYVILGADGEWREKADPMAAQTEVAPETSLDRPRVGLRVGRRRVAGGPRPAHRRARAADVGLRGAPRLVAPAPRRRHLPYATSPTSWSPTSPTWASPTSS